MSERKIAFEFSLAELGLLNTDSDHNLDNLTQLASEILKAPVSLVSIIDHEGDRQVFKSQTGLSEPWASQGETPLSHSFCQHVVSGNQPLIVTDASRHPLVQNNLAVGQLGVKAYLGMPVHTPDGTPFGALCVICTKPREWTLDDQKSLSRIATCVDDLVKLRVANRTSKNLRKELQDFSSALSHNIKAPVRSLVMFHREIEESLGDSISSDVSEILHLCHGATDRATRLIENILSFARLFEDLPAFEPVDLSVLAKEVLYEFEDQAKRVNAQITFGSLPTINGDKTLLHALFSQLVANALIYTHPKQPPCVDISSQISIDGNTATLCFRDSGIGIAKQFHQRVFNLFERLHLKSEYPGYGIGLTLCKRIVDIHSGAIEIQSQDGHGTDILVDLPVKNHA